MLSLPQMLRAGHILEPVAEEMTGWKSEEAVGQPLEKVFNIIHEQTRKPAPNPVSRVLSEGIVVELANHTALIARDGRETAIDDSAAPIRNESGEIYGVVMVFHDVTQRRRVETALRESNRLLSDARDHLEKRVQERTVELASANENLRDLSVRLRQLRCPRPLRIGIAVPRVIADLPAYRGSVLTHNPAVISISRPPRNHHHSQEPPIPRQPTIGAGTITALILFPLKDGHPVAAPPALMQVVSLSYPK